jgi:hypothetical protein
MQEMNENSKRELLEQLNELKEKYNECLQLLLKTQEELAQLRRKSGTKAGLTSGGSIHSYGDDERTSKLQDTSAAYVDDDEASLYELEASFKPTVFLKNKRSSMYSPWMTTNSNSLATEVFATMAKEFRFQNSNMPQQVSQSSDLIRRIKHKVTKQLPGSSNVDSMQSDSEVEMMLK